MRRKLVKQGAATLMISLPSKWLKKFNLGKGDEVEVEESGRNIILGVDPKKKKFETEINLASLTETSIRTIITNVYRAGYDKVKLNFKDKAIIPIIEDVVEHYLIGFEIIKKTENSCEVENITEPSHEHFENIFSKIVLNIDELFEITEKRLLGEKHDFLQVERKIKQFDNFCRRIIAKKGMTEEHQLQIAFHNELIHAQREIYHLLRYISKNKFKIGKQELELLKDCKNLFNIVKEAYEKKSISHLENIHDLEKEIIYKKGYNLAKKTQEPIVVHHLLSAARGFYLASSPLVVLFLSKS